MFLLGVSSLSVLPYFCNCYKRHIARVILQIGLHDIEEEDGNGHEDIDLSDKRETADEKQPRHVEENISHEFRALHLHETVLTLIFFLLQRITRANTKFPTKNPLPTKDPMAIDTPDSISPVAAMEENTSGAPFPSARRVTPAKFSLILHILEMRARAGDR